MSWHVRTPTPWWWHVVVAVALAGLAMLLAGTVAGIARGTHKKVQQPATQPTTWIYRR